LFPIAGAARQRFTTTTNVIGYARRHPQTERATASSVSQPFGYAETNPIDRQNLHRAYTGDKKHKAQRLGWAKYLFYWLRGPATRPRKASESS